MAFIVKKNIKGNEYYYLNKNERVKDKESKSKVKTTTIAYLGKNKKDAEKKAKEIIKKMENESKKKRKKKSKQKDKKVMERKDISIEELASFCKRKGFVYSSGDIYGGLSGFWDFGHLGVEFKNNIKKEWWKFHVSQRDDVVGIDGAIITNPKVWEASGHTESFIDYIVKDKKTGEEFKIDAHEVEKYEKEDKYEVGGKFNPMFITSVGPHEDKNSKVYLRPETAQMIFSNFKYVFDNARLKLPCGIAQAGKAFRNEIAPRDFLFRSREFEQMEIEYFIKSGQKCGFEIPDEKVLVYSEKLQKKEKEPVEMKVEEAFKKGIIKNKWHAYWIASEIRWFRALGADMDKFRIRQHLKDELSHYSSDTWDLEYKFPFGWRELQGFADRGEYDLSQHEKFSGKNMQVFDEETKKKILPCVVCEPSLGVERAFLVFLLDSYFYDSERENIILKLNPKLSPVKAAIFPIVKGEKFEKIARNVYEELKKEFNVVYDASGSVGRRYARADEQGTIACITVDGDSLKDKSATIRDRDTTGQVRVNISELRDILRKVIIDGKSILEFGKKVNTRVK